MARIETYSDVRAEIDRLGLRHQDVASDMGYSPSAFSITLRDRNGKPSAAWLRRFRSVVSEQRKDSAL